MKNTPLNQLDSRFVRRSFDRAAGEYDRHAVLQHEVEQRLMERLEYLRFEPGWILDVGCGTGIASHQMKIRYPDASVVGLDWSKGMLEQLRTRAESDERIATEGMKTLCANMQSIPLPARSMDVVFSSLAIQWSPDSGQLYSELRRVLKPGGMLLFSTFGPDTLHELRSAWASADDRPHVNLFADMHDIGDQVVAAGFVEPVFDVDIITLDYPDVMSLMRDLKAIGAHNAARDRSSGLTGKGKFSRVLEAYEPYRRDDRYPATYEVVYGVAFGPKEGQPFRSDQGDVVTFSVDALKSGNSGAGS